jgi:DNA polymerase-1
MEAQMSWLLIDGNNWFAKDFFAAGELGIRTFLNRLRDVRNDLEPELVAVCWDSESFRKQLSESYKAHRGEKPPGFDKGLAELRLEVESLGLLSYAVPGFEADDLLATIAATAVDEGMQAMVCSADRDLHQTLAAGLVNQVLSVKRTTQIKLAYQVITAKDLKSQYGVHPHQWVDYRSMTGDSSDGIKGCVGIGPKAAVEVLSAFDSLDEFYANPFAARLSDRQRNLLLAFRAELPGVRRLIRLRRDAPLPACWLESVT